jgi:hypothetical protein
MSNTLENMRSFNRQIEEQKRQAHKEIEKELGWAAPFVFPLFLAMLIIPAVLIERIIHYFSPDFQFQ